ncbi:MAG: cupin domain-containing protein, partial [Enterobacterales bacterium]|nr:cupin domain-containing protein [Enterobacterales bacterium]
YKKPNVMHGCVCIEAGTLIDVFTPQREDFIS